MQRLRRLGIGQRQQKHSGHNHRQTPAIMSSHELFDINKQLKHWLKKREEGANWLQKHEVDHPEFEARFREQNNVCIKIDQLRRRQESFKGDIPKTYSLPKGPSIFK